MSYAEGETTQRSEIFTLKHERLMHFKQHRNGPPQIFQKVQTFGGTLHLLQSQTGQVQT